MSDIIGNPTTERELEDQWNAFLSEPVEHQLKLDDESIRLHGKTNKERYEEIKSRFLKRDIPYPTTAEVDNMVHEEVESEVNYNLIDYSTDSIEDAKHWGLINNKAIVYPPKCEEELDKQWHEFNSMIRKHQRESDWKSLELFGMDNKTHYEYLKSKYLKQDIPTPKVDQIEEPIQIASVEETSLDDMGYTMDDSIEYFKDHISDLSTVPQEALPYYDIEEIEYLKGDDFFRYNEKIKDPDITSRAIAIGEFEKAYKEFCETGKRFDTKSWEKNVYKLSATLELARLNGMKDYEAYLEECLIRFGWNPSIPFNEQTRMIGSIRYANKHAVELIDLTESADSVHESKRVSAHLEPVYIVLVQGKSIFSKAIMMKTKGPFSHAAIGLDPSLETLYSYNIDTFGLAVESVKRYSPDTFMNAYCVFVKPDDKKKIERVLKDFTKNRDKTSYSFANIFAFAAGVPIEKQYSKMCSQFVDTVLKLSDIDLTKKTSSLVAPNDFMYAAINDKRIYKLYEGTCGNFDAGELKYKTNKLKKNAVAIKETKDLPVYFDDSGNLLIKNMKKLDLEKEYASCHKLLLSYEKAKNIEGMKYELSKLWFMNSLVETRLHNKNIKDEERDALNRVRARILNDFYKYLDFVQKVEPDFNFNKYYEDTPFSDAMYKVNPSTLKFVVQTVKNLIF